MIAFLYLIVLPTIGAIRIQNSQYEGLHGRKSVAFKQKIQLYVFDETYRQYFSDIKGTFELDAEQLGEVSVEAAEKVIPTATEDFIALSKNSEADGDHAEANLISWQRVKDGWGARVHFQNAKQTLVQLLSKGDQTLSCRRLA